MPAIIDACRSAPKNFLEITKGALQIYELDILEKVRKSEIRANSILDEVRNVVWFKSVSHQLSETGAETVNGIQEQLRRFNVSLEYVTSDNTEGIGVPVPNLDSYFYEEQMQEARKKAEKLSHKQEQHKKKSFLETVLDKVKDLIKD